jgi:hypothetical protein
LHTVASLHQDMINSVESVEAQARKLEFAGGDMSPEKAA